MTQALTGQLALDNSDFLAKMVEAGQVTQREADKIVKAYKYAADQCKELARSQKAANDMAMGMSQSAKHAEELSFASAGAKRELLVLAHEASQGNWKRFAGSLLVIGERTNAMGAIMSTTGASVAGVVAVLGSFAAAAIMGAEQSEKLSKSLILTHNAAGVTSSSFGAIAVGSADSTGSSHGAGREALQDLVSTGRFGQQVIESATRATLMMEQLTGEASDKIVEDFAKMADGVAKWAEEHNRQYHYLSAAQFAYIKQLEDQGKVEQAESENFRILNQQMAESTKNLGYLERAWHAVGNGAHNAWDWMLGLGRAQTLQDQLDATEKALKNEEATLTGYVQNDVDAKSIHAVEAKIKALREQQAVIQENMRMEQRAADASSSNAQTNEAAIKKMMTHEKVQKTPDDTWSSFLTDMKAYEEESTKMLETQQKLNDADRWATEQKAKLENDIKRLGVVAVEVGKQMVDQEAEHRKEIEKGIKAIQMEAEMQKLLEKHGEGSSSHLSRTFTQDEQTAATKYLNGLPDQAKRAEQLVNGSFSRMEDAIVNWAKTGKLSFSDLFGFMSDEYLRNLVRMTEQSLFMDSAGGVSSNSPFGQFIGGLFGTTSATAGSGDGAGDFSNVSSLMGAFMAGSIDGSHAGGLDYVPFDGYLAQLHKGERVQTSLQARAADAEGSVVHIGQGQVINVGQGVSRAEVVAAVTQANAMTMAQIKRLGRFGKLQ